VSVGGYSYWRAAWRGDGGIRISGNRAPAPRHDDFHALGLTHVALPAGMSASSICPGTIDSRDPKATMIQSSCTHLTSLFLVLLDQ
jgi:hypothetical protein